jgi:hypothetical protein
VPALFRRRCPADRSAQSSRHRLPLFHGSSRSTPWLLEGSRQCTSRWLDAAGGSRSHLSRPGLPDSAERSSDASTCRGRLNCAVHRGTALDLRWLDVRLR